MVDPTPMPAGNRTCRLLHRNGLAFDFIVSATFNLDAAITSIRANHYLLVPGSCYIPEPDIAMMFMVQGQHPEPANQVISFPDPKGLA